jgi:hypothetical protein
MPPSDFLLEHLIHELMLLYDAQALELCGLDFNGVHGAAAAAYVLDLWGGDVLARCSIGVEVAVCSEVSLRAWYCLRACVGPAMALDVASAAGGVCIPQV